MTTTMKTPKKSAADERDQLLAYFNMFADMLNEPRAANVTDVAILVVTIHDILAEHLGRAPQFGPDGIP